MVIGVFQQNFVKAHVVAFRAAGQIIFAMVEDFQEALALVGNMDSQRQGVFAVRRQGETVRIGNEAGVNDLAVTTYLKAQCGILGQINEVHVVVQREHARFPVILHNTCRAIDVLELQQPGMRAAVRVDQTVHAEVAVVRPLVMVAAVVVDAAAVECLTFINTVVAPLPQEAPD